MMKVVVNSMQRIKLSIASTSAFTTKNGISALLLDYLRRLDRERYELHLIASEKRDPALLADFQEIGVIVHKAPSRKKSMPRYLAYLFALMRRERYDVFYIHGSSAIMGLELLIAKLCGVPVRIAHSHNTTCEHRSLDKLLRPLFYLTCTDAVACGTEAGRWLFGNRPFTVLKNGRDPETYRFKPSVRERMRRELALPDDVLAVGHAGNFNRQKNHVFLLRVFRELLRERDAKLFLMGDGYARAEIEREIAALRIEDKVVLTGSIRNVPEMLQAMDVMALPSLFEGAPLVAAEWQLAGLPCLISDSVSRECAFTDLARFESLESSYERWAERLLEIAPVNREEASRDAVREAKAHGFDLNAEVRKLERILRGQRSPRDAVPESQGRL